MSIPVDLADAVVTVLNAGSYETEGWTAERSYPDWAEDFSDLETLAVDVVFVSSPTDRGGDVELDSWESLDARPHVDIAVRKRFDHSDRVSPGAATSRIKQASIDPLVRLVEQLYEKMGSQTIRQTPLDLGDSVTANWIDTTVRTYCDYRRLRQGMFLGVVRITYDVSKAIA